ncbi:hypothetical protein NEPAR06_2548, partial [Nematocida parisii]
SIMISIPDNKIKQRVNIESDDNINGWCCIN